MKKLFSMAAVAIAAMSMIGTVSAATLTKAPDMGNYWAPLGNGSATKIYANSFVAPITGNVTELGLWLNQGPSDLTFQIYDSFAGDASFGPDSTAALVSSAVIPGQMFSSLTYVSATPAIGTTLTAGHTYWFAASAVGQATGTHYNVGGHTQNSGGIVDNGTFWYSNAADGVYFDGTRYTPEMAFQVTMAAVPEPASIALLLAGVAVVVGTAARRSTKK
ncbi:MAG: PEP-CTERM sorting domain-containing protein [Pseudomonadota bacterium]